jgi:tetratricopeptide (TPR) repeat protein
VLTAACLALPARGDEASLRRQITALNQITGSAAVEGRYQELKKDPAQARALVKAGLALLKESKKQPLTYNGAYLLARAAQDLKNVKASETFYRVCTKEAVKLESTLKIAQSYGGLLDLLRDAKKLKEAARVCREVLELKPPVDRPRYVLFPVKTETGEEDFQELEHYNSAAVVHPAIQRELIEILTEEGEYDKALKLADSLLKSPGSTWRERQVKGTVLRAAGRYKEAASLYTDILDEVRATKELEPKEKDVLEDHFRQVLSTIYVDMKQIDRATEQLQALVRKHPDDPGYQNDLGYIWADNDMKLAEAEKLIRRALELDRKRRQAKKVDAENGAYLDSLGWVLYKQKKLKEAKEVMQKAVQDKTSQDIVIFEHLGDVHMALGEVDAAIAAYQSGLKVPPATSRDRERRAEVEKKIKQAKSSGSK